MTQRGYFLIFISCFSTVIGQNPANEIPYNIINGFKYSATNRTNQRIFASFVLASFTGSYYDQKIKSHALDKGLLPGKLARIGDLYGGALGHWILWSTIVIHSKLKEESNTEVLTKLEFSSLALFGNAFATYLLKFGVGRERPDNGDYLSFPSGHTSHSFTIAAITNELYGWKAGTVAYLLATLSAVSRIHDNRHYFSDVVFGAGLGTIIGRGFSIQNRKRTKNQVYLLPINYGVKLHIIF